MLSACLIFIIAALQSATFLLKDFKLGSERQLDPADYLESAFNEGLE
jgi:hypothetical protein